MKKVVALLMMPLLGILPAMAQDEVPQVKVTTVTVPDSYWEDASDENSYVLNDNLFQDNWFLGFQAGSMMSWNSHSDKASFMANQNAAFAIQGGKWLAPYLGARLQAFFSHQRGQMVDPDVAYHWTTWGGNFDMLLNFSNMFAKYKENRFFNLVGIIGVGFDHATKFNHKDDRIKYPKANLFAVRAGLEAIFRLSEKWDLNVEATNNWLNDNYDGQVANGRYDGHWDFYLGLTYRFKNHDGAHQFTYARYNASRYDYLNDEANKLRAQAEAKRNGAPIINIEKKVVEGNMVRTLISFEDNKADINQLQEVNVYTAAEDYKKMSDASIYITPYGNEKPANQELFVQRANSIKNMLMNEYSIPAGSIYIESNPQIVNNLNNKNSVIVFVNE